VTEEVLVFRDAGAHVGGVRGEQGPDERRRWVEVVGGRLMYMVG